MKMLQELLHDIRKSDDVILNRIRSQIDQLDKFVLGRFPTFEHDLAKKIGRSPKSMEKDFREQVDVELSAIQRGFFRSEPTEKTLYIGAPSEADLVEAGKYLLATEDEDLARKYARGGIVATVLPGAVTLDFDRLLKSPDGQQTHLFNIGQKFKIVEQGYKKLTIRPI